MSEELEWCLKSCASVISSFKLFH